uniref:COesterase domain-containing protein n=1 Tax=Mesocestoides corti TaxID=53468 RepID=A0A5K3EF84_MESCO
MACDRLRVVEYRKLLEPDAFFNFGRPRVGPPGLAVIFRRPLDKAMLFLIALSVIGLLVHAIVAFLFLPAFPKPSQNASNECAILMGSWNSANTLLRFYGVPYAVPPLAKPDDQTVDLLRQYLGVETGKPSLRWEMPRKISGIEACILAHHDRCSFRKSRWTCQFGRINPISSCAQPLPRSKLDLTDTYTLFQQEKCLQMDIATPLYNGVLRPVVVVIAGFQFFTEPLMPPDYRFPAYWPSDDAVLDTDVVWVYLHYRLGISGFFYNLSAQAASTNSSYSVSFENFALHDQLAGLRWIKQHIKQFGGDPNLITVLGAGSGATSGLALLYMQAKGERLFNQAWLSSGTVHWHTKRDSVKSKNIPSEAFLQLVNRYAGLHCTTGTPGTIVKSCSLKELRKKLMGVPIAVFNSMFPGLFSDGSMIGDIFGSNNNTGGQSWLAEDAGSGVIPPPIYWTPRQIKRILAPREKPIKIVFSSMLSELEGWPGMGKSWMDQPDSSQVNRFAKMLHRFRKVAPSSTVQSLKQLLNTAWNEEVMRAKTEDSTAFSHQRRRQEFNLQLMSILRFSCPQSWILTKLAASDGVFYKLLNTEPPDLAEPFAPGPRPVGKGTPPPKRLAFHALDLMILTGKRTGSRDFGLDETPRKRRFRTYKENLKSMFRAFVHGGEINSQCRATVTGTLCFLKCL